MLAAPQRDVCCLLLQVKKESICLHLPPFDVFFCDSPVYEVYSIYTGSFTLSLFDFSGKGFALEL